MRELDCEESWALKNWCFWTVVLEKTLESPWTARRSNQSILKEVSPGCCLEGMMLKLKLQYFVHLMLRVDSLEKTLMLGGIGGRRKRGWQRMRWLDGITGSMGVSLSELRKMVMDREAWHAAIHEAAKSRTQLRTELNWRWTHYLYSNTFLDFHLLVYFCLFVLFLANSFFHLPRIYYLEELELIPPDTPPQWIFS